MREYGYYVKKAGEYAEDVIAGKQRAGKFTILACKRFLNDLERIENDPNFNYIFSVEKAEHACQFIELLPLTKGKWAIEGKNFELEPWQCFVICNIFGWVDENGYRRFRIVYIEIARKNGKTALASGIALYCGLDDNEPGAEVYMGASNHSQALICYREAKNIIDKDEDLKDHYAVETNAKQIYVPKTLSVIKALPKDTKGSLDGLNVHCAIIDELHAHTSSNTWDAIKLGTGSRTQPLIMGITTAGYNRNGVCYQQHSYLKKILEGTIEDDRYFGVIYSIDDDDAWDDPECWIKANPNFGVSVFKESFESEAKQAKENPTSWTAFLTKKLNVWIGSSVAWMNIDAWDRCKDDKLNEEDIKKKKLDLFVGVDLATKTDFVGVARIYKEVKKDKQGKMQDYYYLFVDHHASENSIEENKTDEVKEWARLGYIKVHNGDTIDFRQIEEEIEELVLKQKPKMIGFDKWQASYIIQNLQNKKVRNVVEFPQNTATMNAPMKELEAAVLDGRLKHNGCPVLSWQMSNIIAKSDYRDNIQPSRDKNAPDNKIDGGVATIMAVGMSMKVDKKKPDIKVFTI